MRNFINMLTGVLTVTFLAACDGYRNTGLSFDQVVMVTEPDLHGTWQVNGAKCNSNAVDYVPLGGTLTFTFSKSTVTQTRTHGECSQASSMPYSFNGTKLEVELGAPVSVVCAPTSCTGPGLLSASACGMAGVNPETLTSSIDLGSNTLITSESDGQATEICDQFGESAPLTMSMTK